MKANRYLTTAWDRMCEFAQGLHQAKAAHDIYRQLNRLDDTRLDELGLKRHDIAQIAFGMTMKGATR